MTLDGVLQGPGGPHEDTTNGFKWSGWQAPFADEVMGTAIEKIMAKPFDLLLGRRTYEIFSAHWPYQHDEIGEKFNRVRKFVVGTTPIDLSWNNTTWINRDVVNELKKLKKEDAPDLLLHGSSRLVQTLFSNQLVDELHLWTYPLTLGSGKKLFDDGTPAQRWTLVESVVSPNGAYLATYVPGGQVETGTFATLPPSDAELARRKKWEKE